MAKEKITMPQFGEWETKGVAPDYSLDFTKIREMRKQSKRDLTRGSFGNDKDLASSPTATTTPTVRANTNANATISHGVRYRHSHTGKKGVFGKFNCFAKV